MIRPLLIACVFGVCPALLLAQPAPITSTSFDFPGSVAGPATTASAGIGLADRWLADVPFDNPAVPAAGVTQGSALLMRISRQDLRADNREFDEQLAFIDGAGAVVGIPYRGLQFSIYGHQPVLRLEDYAYVRGRLASTGPPAILEGNASERELRAGLAVSAPLGPLRIGAAGEWTHRSDTYELEESSGAPDAGLRHADFSGDGFGGQVGARWERGDGTPGSMTLGAAVRWLPSLDLEGKQELELAAIDSVADIRGERESGWEAGVSARVVVAPAIRVVAGAGGSTERAWSGFDAGQGRGFTWGVGADYHDTEEPWVARIGVGQEQTTGVPESRAGVIGIGFGWLFGESSFDVGILRRSLVRADHPTSFDYRGVVTYTSRF